MQKLPIYFNQMPTDLVALVDDQYADVLRTVRWTLSDRQVQRSPRTLIRFRDPDTSQVYNVAFMLNRVVYTMWSLGEHGPEIFRTNKSEFKTTMDQIPRLKMFDGNWFNCQLENLNSAMASSTLQNRRKIALSMGVSHEMLNQAQQSIVSPIALPSRIEPSVVNSKVSPAEELKALAKVIDTSSAVDAIFNKPQADHSKVLDKPPGEFAPPPEDEQSPPTESRP